jgi:sodium-dependent dicarboxylate transporter 2/3/5
MSEATHAGSAAENRSRPIPSLRQTGCGLIVLVLLGLLAFAPMPLETQGRLVVGITALALVGFVATAIPDTAVALAAAFALVMAGVLPAEKLYAALGHELIWLLIGGFMLAGALTRTGLAAAVVSGIAGQARTLGGLLRLLTLAIALTAFLVPSTSGRAALLLPIFMALSGEIRDARVTRALALLFPTAILLSAGASLVGAGAHAVAVEALTRLGGPALGFGGWLVVSGPFALITTALACEIVIRIHLPRDLRTDPAVQTPLAGERFAWTRERVVTAAAALAAVVGAATPYWHGCPHALVFVAAALAAAWPGPSRQRWTRAVGDIDWNLLLFLAGTLAMGEALLSGMTGNDATALLMPNAGALPAMLVWTLVAAIALATHLVIPSRTARVVVLIPAVVLPSSALDLDPAVLILTVTLGSGFCQTFVVSAKPITIFAGAARGMIGPGDLLRLSALLAPMMLVVLLLFALVVWPTLIGAR